MSVAMRRSTRHASAAASATASASVAESQTVAGSQTSSAPSRKSARSRRTAAPSAATRDSEDYDSDNSPNHDSDASIEFNYW